jgi:hypothetical protein
LGLGHYLYPLPQPMLCFLHFPSTRLFLCSLLPHSPLFSFVNLFSVAASAPMPPFLLLGSGLPGSYLQSSALPMPCCLPLLLSSNSTQQFRDPPLSFLVPHWVMPRCLALPPHPHSPRPVGLVLPQLLSFLFSASSLNHFRAYDSLLQQFLVCRTSPGPCPSPALPSSLLSPPFP